jgi:hypothetical protein
MRLLTALLVIFIPTLASAQVPNYFDKPDTRWHVTNTFPETNMNNPSFIAATTTIFGYKGDTTLNNKQWFKLYATQDSLFQQNLRFQGLIRTKKDLVLYRDTLNELDTLYDFGLLIGDSVQYDLPNDLPVNDSVRITNIDSTQINGAYRKRFSFSELQISPGLLNEMWIEGIGSIHSPLFPYDPELISGETPDSLFLSCLYSGNQLVWQKPSYNQCYIQRALGTKTPKAKTGLQLYPNPFKDQIRLEGDQLRALRVTILNSTGQVVREKDVAADQSTLELSGLEKRLYFIQVNNGQQPQTFRMLKR